jgi:hypothetical protein
MTPFKVVCVAEINWVKTNLSPIIKTYFFGLFKKEIPTDKTAIGPKKDEVCLVIGTEDNDKLRYRIKGYPNRYMYDSDFFAPISEIGYEFKETSFKKITERIPSCDN